MWPARHASQLAGVAGRLNLNLIYDKIYSVMRKYELVVLLKASLSDEELEKITKKIIANIESSGAKAVSSSALGKKQLSYLIKGQTEANYVLINFEMAPGGGAKEVETKLRQDENVVRHLLVRKD